MKTGRALGVLGLVLVISGAALFLLSNRARTAVWILMEDGPTTLLQLALGEPGVAWPEGTPEAHGIDRERLEQLSNSLSEANTTSFLVARDGRLVYERYMRDGPNHSHSLAAATKAVVAGLVVLLAVDDQHVALEDLIGKYVPAWRADPWKSQVTIRQVASHRSGMEDLWGGAYQKQREQRFHTALHEAAFLFEPGTEQQYSGTAFYVLARALAVALRDTPEPDIRALLEERIMQPLEIPRYAWSISYGESYHQDGMTLYALGSGGDYVPRALARVGQLLAERGRWKGQQLLSPRAMAILLDAQGLPRVPPRGPLEPPANLGWWMNVDGFSPSLPRDALVALGNGFQVLLVVPSLQLVVVRTGNPFVKRTDPLWPALEHHLFRPLMDSIRPSNDSE